MPRVPSSDSGREHRLTDAPPARARTRVSRHVDYGALQEENRRVGKLGEKLVVEYEQRRLQSAGRFDLATVVRWAANEDGDGLGYDVLSFEITGEKLYIEVKATTLAAETPFYISSAELDFADRHPQTYAIYRVSRVDDAPKVFVLRGPDIAELETVAVTYQARLPRASAYGNDIRNDASKKGSHSTTAAGSPGLLAASGPEGIS